ncbi:hypothetical protein HK098_005449 [Nowakowskiella sp. JEL0407]|nr:hypothetical protein HK098_005449 [Nowakowskiella sp. JEL0407]
MEIIGIFVARFDTFKGNLLEYQYPQSKKIQCTYSPTNRVSLDLNLSGLEYTVIPSGSHLVNNDIIYFKHNQTYGISTCLRINSSHRGKTIISISVLGPTFETLYKHLKFLKSVLNGWKDGMGFSVNGFAEIELKKYYNECNGNNAGRRVAGVHESLMVNPTLNVSVSTVDSKSEGMEGGDIEMEDKNPALFFKNFLKRYNSFVFVLWRYAFLKKRILFFENPPIETSSYHVYCTTLLSSIPHQISCLASIPRAPSMDTLSRDSSSSALLTPPRSRSKSKALSLQFNFSPEHFFDANHPPVVAWNSSPSADMSTPPDSEDRSLQKKLSTKSSVEWGKGLLTRGRRKSKLRMSESKSSLNGNNSVHSTQSSSTTPPATPTAPTTKEQQQIVSEPQHTPQFRSALDSQDAEAFSELSPLFFVNISNISELELMPNYVACTSESIFVEKKWVYDLYVTGGTGLIGEKKPDVGDADGLPSYAGVNGTLKKEWWTKFEFLKKEKVSQVEITEWDRKMWDNLNKYMAAKSVANGNIVKVASRDDMESGRQKVSRLSRKRSGGRRKSFSAKKEKVGWGFEHREKEIDVEEEWVNGWESVQRGVEYFYSLSANLLRNLHILSHSSDPYLRPCRIRYLDFHPINDVEFLKEVIQVYGFKLQITKDHLKGKGGGLAGWLVEGSNKDSASMFDCCPC